MSTRDFNAEVDDLPRNAAGRIHDNALRDWFRSLPPVDITMRIVPPLWVVRAASDQVDPQGDMERVEASFLENVPKIYPGDEAARGAGIGAAVHAIKNQPHLFEHQRLTFELLFLWDLTPNSPQIGIPNKSWYILFVLFDALQGRRDKIDLRVRWMNTAAGDIVTKDIEVINLEPQVLRVANGACQLHASHINREPGYDFAPKFMTQEYADTATLADKRQAVRIWLVEVSRGQLDKILNAGQNMGLIKYWMCEAYNVPEYVRKQDTQIQAYLAEVTELSTAPANVSQQ